MEYVGYQENIPALLQELDLLVVPSLLSDPLPTVVLEAMFYEKPVLATRQGGCLEMIEEDISGFFMPLNNASVSSRILLKILSDRSKLIEAGKIGKERVTELFSPDSFREGWLRIMKR